MITDVIIQISAEVDSIFTTVLKTIVTQTFILDNTVVFITKLSVDGAIGKKTGPKIIILLSLLVSSSTKVIS